MLCGGKLAEGPQVAGQAHQRLVCGKAGTAAAVVRTVSAATAVAVTAQKRPHDSMSAATNRYINPGEAAPACMCHARAVLAVRR
jgi:hypothetical protein